MPKRNVFTHSAALWLVVVPLLSTINQNQNQNQQCFGRNDEGQCGRGDLFDSVGSSPDDLGDALPVVSLGTDVEVESISSGTAATCAVLVGGGLKVLAYKALVTTSAFLFTTIIIFLVRHTDVVVACAILGFFFLRDLRREDFGDLVLPWQKFWVDRTKLSN